MKQMRHWSLMRMLYRPDHLPLRASKWFEGGVRMSFKVSAWLRAISFRKAVRWISVGNFLDGPPCQILSVSLQRKD